MKYPQVYVPVQAKKSISRQPICLTDSYDNYILEEIGCQDKIDFERDVEVHSEMNIIRFYHIFIY